MLTVLLWAMTLSSQGWSQGSLMSSSMVHTDDNTPKYKPGEILVKFKDQIPLKVARINGVVTSAVSSIDQLNKKWGVSQMTPVFKSAPKTLKSLSINLPDGKTKQLEELYNIYKLTFPVGNDINAVLAGYKSLPEVDYAELNGTATIVGDTPTSEPFSMPENKILKSGEVKVTPNDPLYAQQWSIPFIKADSLWGYTTGDTTQVIGILDTGVDWQHPDLAKKIWRNWGEIPDNGIDDDGNGYIDDVRGWDFVNDDNNPNDDNSHGTHCAGIAGAETNNGIGIAGVSWGAKIMAIKVFQSNGIGYYSQIAEGFWYAARNGCTVFSNSWSSNGESITIRLAMEYAYSKGLIVASAGNMNTKTDLPFPPWPPYEPNYPACYNWVLGVEATDQNGNNAWFSNFDPTGPVISDGRPYGSIYYNDFDYNYEMRAPGVSILSTVPGGQYRFYNGTSMACPIVAGGIALMKSFNHSLTNEQVFTKLIQPIKINKMQAGVLDILKCTLKNPPPDLYYVKNEIADILPGDDKDGRPDAGETIEMHVTVKNSGGVSDSIFAKIQFAEFEDKTVAKLLKNTCSIGTISAYGTRKSADAIKIKLDSSLVDARIISFKIVVYEKGKTDSVFNNITLKVEHGIEIKGSYPGLLHLKANAYYLVTQAAVIDSLLIDPGVTLRFKNQMFIMINKNISAIGVPGNMITFTGADDSKVKGIIMNSNVKSVFEYCIFEQGSGAYTDMAYLVNPQKIHNSIFRFNSYKKAFDLNVGMDVQYNVFVDNSFDGYGDQSFIMYMNSQNKFKYNVISNNTDNHLSGAAIKFYANSSDLSNFRDNAFINNVRYSVGTSNYNGWPMGIYRIKKQYWGSTDKNYANSQILDFYKLGDRAVLEADSILSSPPPECHGVTWKVEVNGKNPQDTSLIIGNGPTKFSVFFNRPMDTSVTPFLTFGVRFPYTQNGVMDSAKWSPDHKIWTAYKTIDVSTGDGQNTIRVSNAKDPEHFEIPLERSRFKFVVQAASSQSLEFTATPGIGKVKLEWPYNNKNDVLGYNMYRFTMPTPTSFSDTTLINKSLVNDSIYTDFAVTPGTKYYYLFKSVRTDLSEGDFSKVVQATPISAPNGDANGDLVVNVLDITTIVAYLLNNNPKPFIFEAADLNSDQKINVLDIVGVVNLILNGGKKSGEMAGNLQIHLYMKNDTLFANSKVPIAGLQFQINGVRSVEEIQKLKVLDKFESGYDVNENGMQLVYFSLSGKNIPAGDGIPLLKLKPGSALTESIFADKYGTSIAVDFLVSETGKILLNPNQLVAEMGQNYPNPFNRLTTLPIMIYEQIDEAVIRIYDITGRELKILKLPDPVVGEHLLQWDSGIHKGWFVYQLTVRQGKNQIICPSRKMVVQ